MCSTGPLLLTGRGAEFSLARAIMLLGRAAMSRTGEGEGGVNQRLAAILVADGVGYSRLMAFDDHATLSALDSARAVFKQSVEHARGRVVDIDRKSTRLNSSHDQ